MKYIYTVKKLNNKIMNIKKYKFDYGMQDAFVHFDVDVDIFTEQIAKETLDFFKWEVEPDYENCLIEEALKKYARMMIIIGAFRNISLNQIISEFNELEGYCPLDGTYGITCTLFEGHDFDENELGVCN